MEIETSNSERVWLRLDFYDGRPLSEMIRYLQTVKNTHGDQQIGMVYGAGFHINVGG